MGAITPIGNSVEEYWASLIAGKSGIGWITRFDPSISPVKIAGEVKGFNPDDFIDPKAARRKARFSQFAVATAKQALDSSGYVIDESNSENVAVVFNTGGGGLDVMQEASVGIHERGPR